MHVQRTTMELQKKISDLSQLVCCWIYLFCWVDPLYRADFWGHYYVRKPGESCPDDCRGNGLFAWFLCPFYHHGVLYWKNKIHFEIFGWINEIRGRHHRIAGHHDLF